MNLSQCRTTLQIDLDAIDNNLKKISERSGVPIMAIVKADAYGHGATEISKQISDKVAFFGVACIDEALELRAAGINNPILILGATPVSRFEDAAMNDVRISVFEYDIASELSKVALKLNKTIPFHLVVDTGMNRIGFKMSEENADICKEICKLPGIKAEGIFSHFATADCPDLTRTYAQKKKFTDFIAMLSERGIDIPIKHISNSAGILDFDDNFDMVRSGIITYGMYPSNDVVHSIPDLTPALRWESYVSYIKTLPAGEEISYGGTYVTTKETVIATIPVGYADGYPWRLSGKFYVLINGHKAPIVGRICMDQLMVDISGIPGVVKGNKVTLIGKDGDQVITVEEIAEAAGSFNYEFVCGISRRVTRTYFKNKKAVRYINYLIDIQ